MWTPFPPHKSPSSPSSFHRSIHTHTLEIIKASFPMGNYRFKFSDMIPNAWFYKLNKASRSINQNPMQKPTRKKIQPKPKTSSVSSPSPLSSSSAAAAPPQPHHLCHQRKSYHFTRELSTAHTPTPDNNLASQFSDPPRKSSKKRRSTKKTRPSNRESLDTSSGSAECSCRASLESVWIKPDSTPEGNQNYPLDSCSSGEEDDDDSLFPELGSEIEERSLDKMVSWPNSHHCRVKSGTFIDMNNNPKFEKLSGFDSISRFELPPIITKTDKIEKSEAATKFRRSLAKTEERDPYIISNSSKEQRNSSVRKLSVNSPGVKLRTNSPRIATKRFLQVHGRKSVSSGGGRRSLSESFAIVKSSQDPHRDFRESMVEMIMENNIRTSKDLEDLLACYLSLNSDQYHDLIIKVFKQIWLQITDIRLK